jgi:hypothetical protein
MIYVVVNQPANGRAAGVILRTILLVQLTTAKYFARADHVLIAINADWSIGRRRAV